MVTIGIPVQILSQRHKYSKFFINYKALYLCVGGREERSVCQNNLGAFSKYSVPFHLPLPNNVLLYNCQFVKHFPKCEQFVTQFNIHLKTAHIKMEFHVLLLVMGSNTLASIEAYPSVNDWFYYLYSVVSFNTNYFLACWFSEDLEKML